MKKNFTYDMDSDTPPTVHEPIQVTLADGKERVKELCRASLQGVNVAPPMVRYKPRHGACFLDAIYCAAHRGAIEKATYPKHTPPKDA